MSNPLSFEDAENRKVKAPVQIQQDCLGSPAGDGMSRLHPPK